MVAVANKSLVCAVCYGAKFAQGKWCHRCAKAVRVWENLTLVELEKQVDAAELELRQMRAALGEV